MRYEVTTQKQLNDAIKKAEADDLIVCLGGTAARPLEVRDTVKASVRADGSATVRAYGSATVRAYGSATVRADGSATVLAYDSATVWADGSATVRADGSATVRAYGSATVRAYGSATVRAYGSATVQAGKYVPVQNAYFSCARITGGVLIQLPAEEEWTTDEWFAAAGIEPDSDGVVVLYKAVDDDWSTSHARAQGIYYRPGDLPYAADWDPRPMYGGGLHVSPAPVVAANYNLDATRYVGVPCVAADLVVIDGTKAKIERAAAAVFAVDVRGVRIEAVTEAAA